MNPQTRMSLNTQASAQQLHETTMALTRSMCIAAENGNWNQVIEDEYQRRPLLAHYLHNASPEQAADFILNILRSDKTVLEYGSKARDEFAGELRSISKGQRARVAYAENGI